jgi:hypothetical protein
MIMKATHVYGQDDQPRKKSLMAPLVEGLSPRTARASRPSAILPFCAHGNARFWRQSPGKRPEEPTAISYQITTLKEG